MYLFKRYTNGKSIKSINSSLYHGTLINEDVLSSRRIAGDGGEKLICALNSHGGPRVRMLIAQLLIPNTLIDLLPKSSQHELRKVMVRRWYIVDDRQSFSHIYSDPLFIRNPDRYTHEYYLFLQYTDDPGIAYYEYIVPSIYDKLTDLAPLMPTDNDTHQYDYDYPDRVNVSEDFLVSQSVTRCEYGCLIPDKLFHSISASLDPEYFQWKYYRPV